MHKNVFDKENVNRAGNCKQLDQMQSQVKHTVGYKLAGDGLQNARLTDLD